MRQCVYISPRKRKESQLLNNGMCTLLRSYFRQTRLQIIKQKNCLFYSYQDYVAHYRSSENVETFFPEINMLILHKVKDRRSIF